MNAEQSNTDKSQEPARKKAWQPLNLKVLDVPGGTQAGAGRIQNPEVINFYRPS